jgi:spermidine synthase/MFS family permease
MEIRINKLTVRYIYFILFAISGFSGLIYESIWTHYLKLFLGHAAYAQTLVLVIFMGGMALGAWAASRYGNHIRNLLLGYAIVEGIIGLFAVIFHPLFIQIIDFSYLTAIPQLEGASTVTLFKWTLAALLILPQSILLGMTFPLMSAGIIRLFPNTPGHSLAILYFANSLGAAVGVLVSGFVLIGAVGLPGTILTAGLINILLALIVWLLCHNDNVENPSTFADQHSPQNLSQKVFVAFLLCAALTGTASFLYEIGWIRMLSLVLGSSTHAFELMLSAFILGLALGGFWIRRRIDNLASPIKVLGLIQIIMGILALSTLMSYGHSFEWMSYALTVLTKTDQGYGLFNVFSHAIVLVIMLPATICAGMTLPLLTYYLISKGYGESSIGSIYAANTLGAIVGIVLGVQFIMPELGVKNLITIGSGLDILLGLALLWYAGKAFNKIRWVFVAIVSSTLMIACIVWVELDPLKMASGVFRYGKINQNSQVLFHQDGKTASIDLIKSKFGNLMIATNGKPDAGIGQTNSSADEPTMILLGTLPWAIYEQAKTVATIGFGSGLTSHTLLSIPSLERVDTIEIEPAMVEGAKGFGERVAHVFNDPRSHIHIEDAKAYFTNQQQKYDIIISEPSNPWVSGVSGLFSQEFYQLIQHYISEEGLFVQWFHAYEIDITLVASVIKALSPYFEDYTIYVVSRGDLVIIASKQGKVNEPSDKIFDIPELAATLSHIGISNQQDILLRHLGNKKILEPLFNSYNIPANSDYFPVLDLGAVRTRYLNKNARELEKLRSVAAPLIETLENQSIRTLPLSINENHHLPFGISARQAMFIHQYFKWVATKQATPSLSMDGKTVATIRNIRTIHHLQCQPIENEKWLSFEMKEGWLPYLHFLAKDTLPYLSPSEMAIIWADIEAAPCFTHLPDDIHHWINLYKAVGNRDFEQVLQFAKQLLPDGKIKASENNNYLLMVSMLAHIALKRYEAALVLLERYSLRLKPPIEIRLLGAIAVQQRL